MKTFIEKYTLLIVLLGFAILLVTGSLISRNPWVIVGQLAAIALAISARVAFRGHHIRVTAYPGEGELIRRGPFKIIRHPMYAGVLSLLWVSILGHLSLISAGVGIVVTTFVLMRINAEERLLRERYAEYEGYSRHTSRLIPFVY